MEMRGVDTQGEAWMDDPVFLNEEDSDLKM
jgi:hypothetical protein